MIAVTLFLQWEAATLVGVFSSEPRVQAVGAGFLMIISWNFLAQGIVFVCSGIFQGLGNTRPALVSSAIRLGLFVPIAVWLTTRTGFELEQVWWLSTATVFTQACASYLLLQGQFRRRLTDAPATVAPATP
jgi:Na+-driven multidrug efflux pump